jgi:competence protein ComFC
MWNLLLDGIFPRTSLTGSPGTLLTTEEMAELTSFPVCVDRHMLQANGLSSIDRIVSASSYTYTPLLKKAIYALKYGRVVGLSAYLGIMAKSTLPLLISSMIEGVVLCPVPLHWSRFCVRGYNQAEKIASAISFESKIPYQTLLRRSRATGYQTKRSRQERMTALTHAFICTTLSPPSHVILIDDVTTTGATLNACAHALKKSGVQWVGGMTVAKG